MPNAGNPREPTQGGYTAHALRQKQTPYAPSERRPRHTPQTSEYTDYYKHGGLRRVSGDLLRDADESRGEPCLLTLSLAFYLSVIRKKKEAAYYLITIAVNLVLFPLMYMLNGGVYSGMPLWLAFGLVFPWFAMDGARCCVMFALDLIAALGCLAVQMFFPELILLPEGDLTKMAVLDVAQVMVTVPVMIGLTVKYQSVVFKRQQRKMEQQEKKLLEAMRTADRANEAKTSFLASMSHEIRTPINAVLGMDEMILRESSDESILSYAANIQSAGHSLLSVINDILDLSKIESGRLELLTAEYSTQQLMNDCYSMMIMRAEKKDLLLEIKNDPQLPAGESAEPVQGVPPAGRNDQPPHRRHRSWPQYNKASH